MDKIYNCTFKILIFENMSQTLTEAPYGLVCCVFTFTKIPELYNIIMDTQLISIISLHIMVVSIFIHTTSVQHTARVFIIIISTLKQRNNGTRNLMQKITITHLVNQHNSYYCTSQSIRNFILVMLYGNGINADIPRNYQSIKIKVASS